MTIEQLHKIFLSSSGICSDSRKIFQNCLFIALSGDNFNGNTFAKQALEKGAKYALIDQKEYKINDQTILVNNSLESLQKLANYHRKYLGLKIISLTGSNGKTTTKELINTVLSKKYKTVATVGNLNNHIGVPLTLLSMNKDTEIGIVEMGANHQKEIQFLCNIAEPDYGYITNFGKAHLEGFGGIEGIIKGKSELYDYLIENDKDIFMNADDTIQQQKLKEYKKTVCFSSSKDKCDYQIEFKEVNPFVVFTFDNTRIESKLIGTYNFTNLCAATTIGKHFNVSTDDIKSAIESYIPSNNRSQIIDKGNNKIIMDAYNANPSSMEVALDNLNKLSDNRKIAILGDMFELGNDAPSEHQNIADLVTKLNLDKIYLIGENFNKIYSKNDKIEIFSSFENFKLNFKEISNSTILIKGSRGMALERVLELL
ncbi:UDP-N-acetylmuramoyl-tripeptide--D-alanyl-D-alanine ligase [Mesoflavibacter sp. CH_XMU1404-2]|uniref:UDP-N-acetylmuramoyl-tripeptide--D-alanyl-D- alanine ligase n=1 Tax=Mesoflavibacter sp. CH_XMU1404-2 TaxID=3107766 RepID=UPI003008392B